MLNEQHLKFGCLAWRFVGLYLWIPFIKSLNENGTDRFVEGLTVVDQKQLND